MLCDKTKNYKFLLRSLHEKSLVPMGGKPVILWPSGGRGGGGRGEGADSEVWNRVYMIDSVTDRLQGCGLFIPCEQRFISGIAFTRAESFIASLSFALFALFFYKLQLHLPSRLHLLMGPRAASLAFL